MGNLPSRFCQFLPIFADICKFLLKNYEGPKYQNFENSGRYKNLIIFIKKFRILILILMVL